MLRGYVSVLALTIAGAARILPAGAVEATSPAHAIAQKFAAPTETAAPPPATAQAAPQTSAKTTAQPATKPEPAKAEPAKSDTAKAAPAKVETAKGDAAKSDSAKAERPPLDYEMDMLRQARAEQAAVKAAKSAATPPSPVTTSATTAPASVKPPAAPVSVAAPVAAAATAAVPAATAKVEPVVAPPAVAPTPAPPVSPVAPPNVAPAAPTAVEPPTKTAEAPAAPAAAATPPPLEAKTPEATKPAESAQTKPAAASGPTKQATLLLALETSSGSANRPSSAANFDPIVCFNDACFISSGLQADAIKIAKSDAIKLKTTEDASTASCKGMIACVFRNIAVPTGAEFQVIELGSASHGSSRASDLKVDASCKVTEGELGCDEPLATPDFKVWVVPEETARAAGVQAIEDAVADGLPHVDIARSTDK